MSIDNKSVGIAQDKGAMKTKARYCVECGAKAPDAARVCPACGETL
jgi:ribosomal protein L40E